MSRRAVSRRRLQQPPVELPSRITEAVPANRRGGGYRPAWRLAVAIRASRWHRSISTAFAPTNRQRADDADRPVAEYRAGAATRDAHWWTRTGPARAPRR